MPGLCGLYALNFNNLTGQWFELLLGGRVTIQRAGAELAQRRLQGVE